MTDAQPPAGWFADPSDGSRLRYWDGTRWTEHVHARPVQPPAPAAQHPAQPVQHPGPGAQHPPAPLPPRRKSRAPLIVTLVAVGVVAALAIVVGVAWAPVQAALFPKIALSDSPMYLDAEEALRETFDEVPAAPLEFPSGDTPGVRKARAFLVAAERYIDEYIDQYGADERIFDSQADADRFAFEQTMAEFSDLREKLWSGGIDLPIAQQGFPMDPEVVALEQQIAAMPVTPGADGSYWDAGQAIAAVMGTTVTRDHSINVCVDGFTTVEPTASFCPAEANWDEIFVEPAGESLIGDPEWVDTVKHELSHKLIYLQCSGVLTGVDYSLWNQQYGEGVTNSYAVLFLGADAENLNGSGDYAMTDETYARAQALHDSDLGCFDALQAPTEPVYDE